MGVLEYLNGKNHVGYVVADAEKTAKQLEETFGKCLSVKIYTFRPTKSWSFGQEVENLELKIAMCQVTDEIAYEIIEPVSEKGFHYVSLQAQGDHVNHVAVDTEHYDEVRAAFVDAQAEFVFEAETNDQLNGYRRCAYMRLPGLAGVYEIKEKATAYREPTE